MLRSAAHDSPGRSPRARCGSPHLRRARPAHIGTAYMSLFNYVFAKQQGGKFILRIEDTDRSRYRADSEQLIFDALRWVGLPWDEGPDVGGPHAPYRQSERTHIYREHAAKQLASGAAYRCFCTEERLAKIRVLQEASAQKGYDRLCRKLDRADSARRAAAGEERTSSAWAMPLDGAVTFGSIASAAIQSVEASQLNDHVLMKSDGFPTYHPRRAIVDDMLMEISHVVRGEEVACLVDADARGAVPRARQRAADLLPHAADAKRGRLEDLEAQEPDVDLLLPRPRPHARGVPQLPRHARLVVRRRPREVHARRDAGRVLVGSHLARRPGVRSREADGAQREVHPRARRGGAGGSHHRVAVQPRPPAEADAARAQAHQALRRVRPARAVLLHERSRLRAGDRGNEDRRRRRPPRSPTP